MCDVTFDRVNNGMQVHHDTDITAEIAFHQRHGKWATGAGMHAPGRYSALQLDGNSKGLDALVSHGQLIAFEVHGFRRPMDTSRDKNQLEELRAAAAAPWKIR
jgi:glucose-1-phosphate cytidylyltransferase